MFGLGEFHQLEPRRNAEDHRQDDEDAYGEHRRSKTVQTRGKSDPGEVDVRPLRGDEPENAHHGARGSGNCQGGDGEPAEPARAVDGCGAGQEELATRQGPNKL